MHLLFCHNLCISYWLDNIGAVPYTFSLRNSSSADMKVVGKSARGYCSRVEFQTS